MDGEQQGGGHVSRLVRSNSSPGKPPVGWQGTEREQQQDEEDLQVSGDEGAVVEGGPSWPEGVRRRRQAHQQGSSRGSLMVVEEEEDDDEEEEEDDETGSPTPLEERERPPAGELLRMRAATSSTSSSEEKQQQQQQHQPKEEAGKKSAPSSAPSSLLSSLRDYMVDELDVSLETPVKSCSFGEESDVGLIRKELQDFVSVPFQLEKFLVVGVCACADAFLYVFTMLPLRLVMSLVMLLTGRVRRLKRSHVTDFMKLGVMAGCVYILFFYNYSKIYHYVRGESPLKLYVIYNLLEVFDRLFCAFGQSILYSFFWSMCAPRSETSYTYRASTFVGTLLYMVGHTTVLLGQVVSLNVALNSRNNDIITLLISNNFVEVKSNVFKRLDAKNIFQIACSDAVERVQVFLFGVVVVIQNLYAAGEAEVQWVLFVLIAEVAVDWIKHCFLIKFNGIPSSSYSDYCEELCENIARYTSDVAELDVPGYMCRALGFVPLPLSCLIIRFTGETTFKMFEFHIWLGILLALFLGLLVLKLTLKYLLVRFAKSILVRKARRRITTTHGGQHQHQHQHQHQLQHQHQHGNSTGSTLLGANSADELHNM